MPDPEDAFIFLASVFEQLENFFDYCCKFCPFLKDNFINL